MEYLFSQISIIAKCVYVCGKCPQRPGCVSSLRTRAASVYKPPNGGAENQTWVLSKSSTCSH